MEATEVVAVQARVADLEKMEVRGAPDLDLIVGAAATRAATGVPAAEEEAVGVAAMAAAAPAASSMGCL